MEEARRGFAEFTEPSLHIELALVAHRYALASEDFEAAYHAG